MKKLTDEELEDIENAGHDDWDWSKYCLLQHIQAITKERDELKRQERDDRNIIDSLKQQRDELREMLEGWLELDDRPDGFEAGQDRMRWREKVMDYLRRNK